MNLFGARKPDHPMAEPKEARRLLDKLPGHDGKALEELGHWHESLVAAGFKAEELASRLAMVDEAARPRLEKVARQYLAATRRGGSRGQETVLWSRMHEYWRQAGQAHVRCIDAVVQAGKGAEAKALASAVRGALRALGQQLKWQQLRSGPVDPETWGLVNRIFALAEARGVAEAKQDFLKAALLAASSPDSLLPAELAPALAIAASPAPDLGHWTDLAKPMAPARAARPPQPGASIRWLGAGAAFGRLTALIKSAEAARQVPSELKLGAEYDVEMALGVMRHLALHWAPQPPERRHARRSIRAHLTIVHGFDGVLHALGGAEDSINFEASAPEIWEVENVSAGGFGALVPQAKGDWLKVGALVAVGPEGTASWMVGAVRRVSRVSNQQIRVGVLTLSRAPALAEFWLRSAGQTQGVLLPPAVPAAGETAIALRAGVYVPGENLEAKIHGRQHVYLPQSVVERGDDYDIVKFREMIRES